MAGVHLEVVVLLRRWPMQKIFFKSTVMDSWSWQYMYMNTRITVRPLVRWSVGLLVCQTDGPS